MIVYEEFRSYLNYETFEREDENLNFESHMHNSFELLYVKRGSVTVTIEENKYDVNSGEAILIFPNRIHSYVSKNGTVSLLNIFAINYISSFYHRVKDKSPKNPVFKLDYGIIDELHDPSADKYLLKSVYYKIAHILNKSTTLETRKSKEKDSYVKILSFISEHFQEQITALDIAKALGYDHRYVTALIKKGFHTTFRSLLNEHRISLAQHLLTTETKTISQIAYECGYDSLCSFNRNFKALTGISPKEYRQDRAVQ